MRDALVPGAMAPIIFDLLTASGPDGIRFDVWYGGEYLPALARAYPTNHVRRYAAPSRGAYLVIGELDRDHEPAGGAMPSHPNVAKVERFVGQPVGSLRRRDVGEDAVESAIAYPACLRVSEHRLPELGRWYDEEHLPMLLSCPQWLMTRRFHVRAAQGTDWTHVAVHHLSDWRALASPARDRARDTPWRDRLIAEGWFAPDYHVCYRLQDR